MKQTVIVGHPKADSFTLAVAHRYAEACRSRGHEVLVRDLYRMAFDPCLGAHEIPNPKGFAPRAEIVTERGLLADVETFVFVYPLWFYDRPAIVKGYIDRVFGMGFGYGPIVGGANEALLSDRRLLSFTSSGAPLSWMEEEGTWTAVRTLLDLHLARVTGLQVLDHVHFGGVTPEMSDNAFDDCMRQVDATAARLF